MELYTGVDSVSVDRIAKSLESARFTERFFSQEEQSYFKTKGKMGLAQTVAGHFAAKEAFSKAMGTGVRGFDLNEVGIIHDNNGKPSFLLTGRAKALCGKKRLSLSITHTEIAATAFVVAWEE